MKIYLSNDQSKFFDIPTEISSINVKERIKSAHKIFWFFMGLAFVSIFIPVLHFFLVPLFLFLAFMLGYKEFKIKEKIDLGSERACLHCGKNLKAVYRLSEDHKFKCEHCGYNYIII